MKTTKLVLGILSMIIFILLSMQSCAVTALSFGLDVSGAIGLLLSFSYLASGIVAVAGRKSKGGSIAAAIIILLGALLSVLGMSDFSDLKVWGGLAFAIGITYLIFGIVQKKNKKVKVAEASEE